MFQSVSCVPHKYFVGFGAFSISNQAKDVYICNVYSNSMTCLIDVDIMVLLHNCNFKEI